MLEIVIPFYLDKVVCACLAGHRGFHPRATTQSHRGRGGNETIEGG